MENIYFRVDGSATIGLGHLYRTLAIYQMIERQYDSTFVISSSSKVAIPILEDHEVQNYTIDDDESYIDRLTKKDIVILDGYEFDSFYQLKIKEKGAKLIVIDDLHDKHFYADALINTALGLSEALYKAEKYTNFYLGPDYVLLRFPFLERAKLPDSNSKSGIVICVGGSDPLNITGQIVSILLNQFTDQITVVLGAGFVNEGPLRALINQSSNVRVFQNLSAGELVNLFSENEIIITSASVTAYEALCCNRNLIVGHYADNQLDMYNGLISANSALGVGSFTKVDKSRLHKEIIQLKSPHNPSNRIIDGRSPERILEIIKGLDLSNEHMRIRRATIDDALLLFEWANESDVRANSINGSKILWDNHMSWLKTKLDSSDVLLILERNGIPVGQIRFDYDQMECHWIINFSVSKNNRGQGLGKSVVACGIRHLNKFPMVAYVKPSNIPSIKVFESLDFTNTGLTTLNNVQLLQFIKLA